MARGTVKDPTGHQSKNYDFGYVQREAGAPEWPDNGGPKVIPFLNRVDNGDRIYDKAGDPVDYVPRRANVVYKGRIMGSIGIALLKEQLGEFNEVYPDDPEPSK